MQVGRVLPRSLLLLAFLASFRIYTLSEVKKCSSIVSATFHWNDKARFTYHEASNIDFAFVNSCGPSCHVGFLGRVVGRRKHFFYRKFAYYCNTSASFQLRNILVCGDVHRNPGYGCDTSASNGERGRNARKPPTWKYPCAACSKPVRSSQKGILCDGCCKWHHIKCVNMDHRLYRELSSSDDTWYCTNCSFPFNFTDSFFEEPVTSEEAPVTITLESNPTDNITTGRQSLFPKVLVLNARSIRNKVFDLQALLLTDCVDIIALTETWLDDYFLDSELHLNDYNIFRKDRSNRCGGGVLLAIKDQISCIHRTDLETESEMLALEIHPNPTCSILLAVFYRPPNADESFLADFRYFLDKYSGTGLTNLVVVGDFNFPNIDWNLGCPTGSDPETVEFCNILDDFFLLQNNLHVTRDTSNPGSNGNILDLVLTNDEFLVDDVLVHPNAFDSDHHPLTFKLHVKKTRPRNAQRKVYCYRSGDFNGLRETLRTLPWDLVTSDTSIDTSLDKFQDMLFCAIEHHIPQRTLKRRSRPPWIDNEIMKLIRKKKKLWNV